MQWMTNLVYVIAMAVAIAFVSTAAVISNVNAEPDAETQQRIFDNLQTPAEKQDEQGNSENYDRMNSLSESVVQDSDEDGTANHWDSEPDNPTED